MGVKVRERKGMDRYLTFGFLILMFSISMTVSAFGGQFEDATAAYERGDYATAFRLMKPLAEKGDAKAQHNLGVMYDYGRGVPQDYTKALKWYRMSAEHGIPEAQHNLGLMYYQGQGVPQNYAEAAKVVPKGRRAGNGRFSGEPRHYVLPRPRRIAGLCPGAYVAQSCGFTVPCVGKREPE